MKTANLNCCIFASNLLIFFAMNTTVVIGCAVTIVALVVSFSLVLWSRRTIDRIARDGFRSARETLKGLSDEK